MASKTLCCGLIILLFLVLIVLFIAADIYNTSYQRSPEVREAHERLEDSIDHAKDSITDITAIIHTNRYTHLTTTLFFKLFNINNWTI
ncbi:MAG: hypothetical protein E7Z84_07115 [Methanosphaera stadtmanae]|nr:hypothetical protein [Methanosphaera stadtmanae]